MKVLMFGWEFPPFNTGGLGTACFGLTKALSEKNVEVTFVMPRIPDKNMKSHVKLVGANDLAHVKIRQVDSLLQGYMNEDQYDESYQDLLHQGETGKLNLYGKNLFAEVERFAKQAKIIAQNEDFDVIHAHDWMTYKAGIAAKEVSGKPLVVHMHATEFDRTGGNGVNQYVYDIEKYGMHAADQVMTVSNFTKDMVTNHYSVPHERIHVVHNGVEFNEQNVSFRSKLSGENNIVLFLGRITLQKGPDYFVDMAKKVLELNPNTTFVMAGSGDMAGKMIQKAAALGIGDRILFTGFLRGEDVAKAYQMADLYVMPSVSEPFGITPLESLKSGTPVLISNQAGVSEVLTHCLKADFWDIDEMTNKIVNVLNYAPLHTSLVENGMQNVRGITWHQAADKCINVYQDVVGG